MTPEREGFWVFSNCRVSNPARSNGDLSSVDEAEAPLAKEEHIEPGSEETRLIYTAGC